MLVDEIDVAIVAGHGGPGKVSFGRMFHSGPDGGNGGKGGDVYISVTSDLHALNHYVQHPHIKALDGQPGKSNRAFGKDAPDITISLPIGSGLHDLDTGENIELNDLQQKILICRGGLGGRGNYEFKSGTNINPDYAQPGLPGEEKHFHVVLKFIAEYGLVGLPNAGKSSLLNELTHAKAEVGAYPFTTLEANLGSFHGKIIADIPGLIEGASAGKGLGFKFLKHIEKVKKLLHCISADSEDVVKDYQTINNELASYNPVLIKKGRLILLTKTDLASNELVQQQTEILKQFGFPIFPVSIHDWDSLSRLQSAL